MIGMKIATSFLGNFFFMNYYIYCGADFKVDIKIDRKDEIDGASARGAVDA